MKYKVYSFINTRHEQIADIISRGRLSSDWNTYLEDMKLKTNECKGFPSGALKAIHLIAVIHFGFALYYDSTYVHFPSTKGTPNEFGGKLKYLTILNVVSIPYINLTRRIFVQENDTDA